MKAAAIGAGPHGCWKIELLSEMGGVELAAGVDERPDHHLASAVFEMAGY